MKKLTNKQKKIVKFVEDEKRKLREIMKINLRKEFKNSFWQQGRVLYTRAILEIPQKEIDRIDKIEQKMCFVNFSASDEGKSRICIFIYSTAKKCERAVKKHNKKLEEGK